MSGAGIGTGGRNRRRAGRLLIAGGRISAGGSANPIGSTSGGTSAIGVPVATGSVADATNGPEITADRHASVDKV
jgi:hypothetical protein